ncbi:MAG: hypothetical protein WA823_13555 [Candidatus Acidiferrales bacterium]
MASKKDNKKLHKGKGLKSLKTTKVVDATSPTLQNFCVPGKHYT